MAAHQLQPDFSSLLTSCMTKTYECCENKFLVNSYSNILTKHCTITKSFCPHSPPVTDNYLLLTGIMSSDGEGCRPVSSIVIPNMELVTLELNLKVTNLTNKRLSLKINITEVVYLYYLYKYSIFVVLGLCNHDWNVYSHDQQRQAPSLNKYYLLKILQVVNLKQTLLTTQIENDHSECSSHRRWNQNQVSRCL